MTKTNLLLALCLVQLLQPPMCRAQAGAKAPSAEAQVGSPQVGIQSDPADPLRGAPGQTSAAAPGSGELARRCGEGRWKLDGASSAADEGADYNEVWTDALDLVAQCGQVLRFTSGCLQIRGHYDEVEFKGGTAVVGGRARAQQLRAESRASRVAQELRRRGVDASVLRDRLPPNDFPTFRGVTIDVAPDCRDSVVEAYAAAIARQVVAEQQRAAAPAVVVEPSKQTKETKDEEPEQSATQVRENRRRPIDSAWASAATGPGVMYFPKADKESVSAQVVAEFSVGAMLQRFYLDGRGTLQSSLEDESRLGYGFAASAGYAIREPHWVGLVAGARFATYEAAGPWLTRVWTVGVEGRHYVWRNGASRLFIWEAVEPFGKYVRRAEVIEGEAERGIPRVEQWAMRAIAGVGYRFEVLR